MTCCPLEADAAHRALDLRESPKGLKYPRDCKLRGCVVRIRRKYRRIRSQGRSFVTQKREKFRELAEGRTTKALDAIARIGNLSNRQVYEYEDAEVKKIMRALRDAVAEVEARFEAPRTRKSGFKL
jgi:hypothetical protein